MSANFAWAIIKFILAYFFSSFFLSLSAFYTICIALAKCSYFDGIRNTKIYFEKEKYYKQIASMIISAGFIYLLYIIELFLKSNQQEYDIIVAITIAFIAFVELFFSIRGLLKSWKYKDLLLIGLKFINVCSALSSLVLTQIALLALSNNTKDVIIYNTLFGMFMGLITIFIGIYMFIYLNLFNKKYLFIIKKKNKYNLNVNNLNLYKNKFNPRRKQ